MHNRFDQFAKGLAREGLSPAGRVETEAEATPNALRIDVWFVPYAGRAYKRVLAPLGLLGRMARDGREIVMILGGQPVRELAREQEDPRGSELLLDLGERFVGGNRGGSMHRATIGERSSTREGRDCRSST